MDSSRAHHLERQEVSAAFVQGRLLAGKFVGRGSRAAAGTALTATPAVSEAEHVRWPSRCPITSSSADQLTSAMCRSDPAKPDGADDAVFEVNRRACTFTSSQQLVPDQLHPSAGNAHLGDRRAAGHRRIVVV
jgi:hypothetical protein